MGELWIDPEVAPSVGEVEESARALLEHAPVGIWVTEPDGRIRDVNPAACEMLGYPRTELLGSSFYDLLHPDDVGQHQEVERVPSGDALLAWHRLRHRAGHFVLVEGRARKLPSGQLLTVVSDISELRQAEATLAASEAEYRAVFEVSPSAKAITECSTRRFLRVNRRFCELTGYTPEELAALTLDDLTHPDDRARTRQLHGQLLDGSANTVSLEKRYLRKDGQERWVWVTASVLKDKRGRPYRIVAIVTDITARRAMEEELRRSESLLRLAQRAAHAGVWELDPATGAARMSPESHELYGTHPEQLPPTFEARLSRVLPEDLPRVRRTIDEVVAQGSELDIEFRIRHPTRGVRWLWELGRAEQSADGWPTRVRGISLDISERKQAEVQLRRSEVLYRTLGDALPNLVWMMSASGRLEYVNQRMTEYTGLTLEQLDQAGWQCASHPEDASALHARWAEATLARGHFEAELRYARRDGTYRWFLARALPMLDESGELLRWVGTLTDIDDRKRAEQSLQEMDRRKDEFLAVLSHELRNPLTPIRNSLVVLSRAGADSPQAHRAREVIDRQVHHLTQLVDDLLDLTRVSRGKISLRLGRVDLRELVARTAEDHRTLFVNAGIELVVERTDEPLSVLGDPIRLGQVIGNLLQNAAKFTPRGGRVRVCTEASAVGAILRVEDTGVGIEPEMLERLFQPFAQADRTLNRSYGGLGLGLALVRGLVELHNGRVDATSGGLHQGAQFTVQLPLADAPPGLVPPKGIDRTEPIGRRVLVVEDNRDAAESLRDILEMVGHQVEVVYDGSEAVQRALAFRPEVVVCDIGLPGMSGYEVAQALRKQEGLQDVFLLALSGYAQPEDQRKAAAAGFDRHLAKPPTLEKLEEALSSVPPAAGS